MAGSSDRLERVQVCRRCDREQTAPHPGAKARDTRQLGFEVAEADRAHQPGQVGAELADAGAARRVRTHGHDQDQRRPAQRRQHSLRLGHRRTPIHSVATRVSIVALWHGHVE